MWWVEWWVEEPQKHRAPWLEALLSYMAEEVRFELTEDFHPRQFSRLVHSTALPLFLCDLALDYKEFLILPSK